MSSIAAVEALDKATADIMLDMDWPMISDDYAVAYSPKAEEPSVYSIR